MALSYDPGDGWYGPPPAYDTYLKGGACSLRFTPAPRRRPTLEDVHLIHGAVSTVLGESGVPHHDRWPVFSLSLDAVGQITLLLFDEDACAVIANGRCRVHVGDVPATMHVGPLTRMRAPIVFGSGPRLLRVSAETPVVIRRTVRNAAPGHRGGYHATPTTENLRHAIGHQFAARFGLGHQEFGRIELVDRWTHGVRRTSGAKVKFTWGWLGDVTLKVDATGEWLLRLAEIVGLGGRTAYGFGRVRVEKAR